MIERARVLEEARSYIGTRWEHLGRTPRGLDCVGLVVIVCKTLGLSDYDLQTYSREPVASQFLSHFIGGGGTRIPLDSAQPGDLIVFREERFPCHVAFRSEKAPSPDEAPLNTIIHAHTTRRKVVEEPMIDHWMAKRVAAIRLPGVV